MKACFLPEGPGTAEILPQVLRQAFSSIVKKRCGCYNADMNNYENINRQRMKQRFFESCKDDCDKSLYGLEIEQFLVHADTGKSVGYYGKEGVEEILKELEPYSDSQTWSEGHLIGLAQKDLAVTIEPAAQFEISVSPQYELSEIDRIYRQFMQKLEPILKKRRLFLVPCGYQPVSRIDDLKLIPKQRYEFMYRYFSELKGLGPNMMKGTASVHLSIDYCSEGNFRKKYGIAYALAPVLSFMTENTKVFEGRPYDRHLLRLKIWNETDPARVDVSPYMKDGGMDFDRYIDFVCHAPVIVEETEDGERYSKETIGSLLAKREYDDAGLDHLESMVFPLIRLKGFLEIRAADAMPWPEVMAYMCFIKGLLTEPGAADSYVGKLLEANPDWYDTAFSKIEKAGAEAEFAGRTLREIEDRLMQIALHQLEGADRDYLASFEEKIREKGTFV